MSDSDGIVFRRPVGVESACLPGDWMQVRRRGESAGVVLDSELFAVWSAADGNSGAAVAQSAELPRRFARCALNALRRGGLLLPAVAVCYPEVQSEATDWGSGIAVVLIHSREGADIHSAYASIKDQVRSRLHDVTVIAGAAECPPLEGVRVRRCDGSSLTHALVEEMAAARGESILLLDTAHKLGAGALAELRYPGRVRSDVVAVGTRTMWDSWPSFVVHVGDWRDAEEVRRNPFAGQLDVGQYAARWLEAPAVCFTSALIRHDALDSVGLPDPGYSLDWMGLEWCYRARRHGYHVLAATQALALGPWPVPIDLAQETYNKLRFVAEHLDRERARWMMKAYRREDRRRDPHARQAARRGWSAFRQRDRAGRGAGKVGRRSEQFAQLIAPGDGPRVHERMPVLTVDIVRSLCMQSAAVDPQPAEPARSRVVFVGSDVGRYRSIAGGLEPVGELEYVSASDHLDIVRRRCDSADGLIVSVGSVRRIGFLQDWLKPMLVDVGSEAQPGEANGLESVAEWPGPRESPRDDLRWLVNVEGLICASENQRLFWLGKLAGCGRLDALATDNGGGIGNPVAVTLPWKAGNTSPSVGRQNGTHQQPEFAETQKTRIPAALQSFCTHPRLALDRQVRRAVADSRHAPSALPTPVWQLPRRLWWALRDEGLRGATRQVAQYLSWIAAR